MEEVEADEAEVPTSVVAFSGEVFGGDVLIYLDTRLSKKHLAQFLARVERRREAVAGMSPSEVLRYMRTQDGKEADEVLRWYREVREWQEERGLMHDVADMSGEFESLGM